MAATAPAPAALESPPAALDELAVLGSAEDALRRGDPASALQLASEHEAAAAAGLLTEEREVIAIDALGRLGRAGDVSWTILGSIFSHSIVPFGRSACQGGAPSRPGSATRRT
jgi:hypothetical protein